MNFKKVVDTCKTKWDTNCFYREYGVIPQVRLFPQGHKMTLSFDKKMEDETVSYADIEAVVTKYRLGMELGSRDRN